MSTRSAVVQPTFPSQALAQPEIDSSANIHPFCQLTGDVKIAENAFVAPGASICADGGCSFSIGAGSSVQDGVIVRSSREGQILGDDGYSYSVWVGEDVCITHKSLIQGPVYVGDGVFVGFRSTILNSRLSPGCIVMMHALVQDVEIPSGKVVPSGSVITTQAQADQLPEVSPQDLAFVQEFTSINRTLRTGFPHAGIRSAAHEPTPRRAPLISIAQDNGTKTMQSQNLTADIVQQVRQLLSQGYRIGIEHADIRRYRSNVWQTCPTVQSTHEREVMSALERCMQEHAGEFVRIFGIDPIAKRRVATTTIQRADGKAVEVHSQSVPAAGNSDSSATSGSRPRGSDGGNTVGLAQQVRSWISQGYRIGLEHADSRRFRSNVWQSCSPVQSSSDREAMAALQACMDDHQGEYVRMFGIDPVAKRRVAPVIIQRPEGRASLDAAGVTAHSSSSSSNNGSLSHGAPNAAAGGLSADVAQKVRSLLSQGYQIGTEHADSRRFRSNVWQTCSPIEASREPEVLSALNACVQEHAGEYVRMFGIDPSAKKRLDPTIIHRPGDQLGNGRVASTGTASAATAPTPSASTSHSYGSGASQNGNGNAGVSNDVVQQVRQLVGQGYRISVEHADVRRYRSGAWQSGGILEGHNPSAIIAALESSLASHSGEYVRLVGIDPQAKRRVLETTIQRP